MQKTAIDFSLYIAGKETEQNFSNLFTCLFCQIAVLREAIYTLQKKKK